MAELPTGLVTFLFTDIVDSTPLWEREPEKMRVALEQHHAILRAAIESNGGQVFKIIGDAFQAAFAVPARAVEAAIVAQRKLASEAWPTSSPIRVRMGLHVGHAVAQANDYTTTHTLNRVARIMSTGHGGQILISVEVANLVRGELPAGVTLRDMGEHRMKGMTQLEYLFQVIAPDLPADFPPLSTLAVSPNNLPTPLTSFIGRDTEVAEVKRLLPEARLVTLTGSGGCGKTRLALQAASELGANYSNGVWFVELAPIADPMLVPQILLAIFNLREDSHRTALDVLMDYLRAKTLLLVLDNCEHLIETCAQISKSLLQACPKLKILASSREALGIAGEAPYRVPSLATPNPERLPALEKFLEVDSIRLFIERATTAKPDFTLTKDNASFVAQICFRLDGIPLAIELAAARVKMLSPEQIASRLDDRFRLLTGGSRTALPRQQTLRALIDWSYSLLSEPEKTLFRRLAVFVGGWTLEAAESVCGEERGGADVLDLLTRLVDKSLVFSEESTGEIRYHRLETIRQYSREKFLETDEVETIRNRHLAFYVQFSQEAEKHMQGRERLKWTHLLEAEQDNLRAAMEWGLARNPENALRIAASMPTFWTAGGYSAEGFRWLQQALERVEATKGYKQLSLRAKALVGLALLYLSFGDNINARHVAEESVALYRQSQDRYGLAYALGILAMPYGFLGEGTQAEAALKEGIVIARAEKNVFALVWGLNNLSLATLVLHGDLETAQRYTDEVRQISQEAGIEWTAANAYQMSGLIAARRQEFDKARAHFEQSIMALQRIDAHFNVILVKSDLAHLERQLGNHQRALELYHKTLVAFRDMGQTGAVAHQLECFGFIALAQNQNERALQLFAAANALREKGGTPMTPDEQIYFDEQLKGLRLKINSVQFDSKWAKGRAMTMEQAIQFALQVDT